MICGTTLRVVNCDAEHRSTLVEKMGLSASRRIRWY